MASVPLSLDLPHHGSVRCVISPVVLFSILDHYLRRNEGQSRVIGTLLGSRSDDGSEIEIKNCFNVPHNETEDQVAVDMEHHKTLFELHQRVNPKEVIVGWYATGDTLNSFSALIQDFYEKETGIHSTVHLTMDTVGAVAGNDGMGIKTYISSPIGTGNIAESCLFLPTTHEVKYFDAEKSGLEVIKNAAKDPNQVANLATDMDHLEQAITQVQQMLDRICTYVENVLNGSQVPNNSLGRYLMQTISAVPTVDPQAFEKMFNSHLQDLLMVVYLANMTRTQLSIAERLQVLV